MANVIGDRPPSDLSVSIAHHNTRPIMSRARPLGRTVFGFIHFERNDGSLSTVIFTRVPRDGSSSPSRFTDTRGDFRIMRNDEGTGEVPRVRTTRISRGFFPRTNEARGTTSGPRTVLHLRATVAKLLLLRGWCSRDFPGYRAESL